MNIFSAVYICNREIYKVIKKFTALENTGMIGKEQNTYEEKV